MSRVIKFRAWQDYNESMKYHEERIGHTSGDILNSCLSTNIMQFSNLLDKNGKEIYEGDILELIDQEIEGKQTEFGQVVVKFGEYSTLDIESGDISLGWYVEGFHGYRRIDGTKDRYVKLDSLLTCIKDKWNKGWEVVGNIYQNPELIKLKNK